MQPADVAAIVEVVRKIQRERRWTFTALSWKMRVSRGHLCMIMLGRRKPGLKFIRAAIRTFPEVRALLRKRIADPPPGRAGNGHYRAHAPGRDAAQGRDEPDEP